MHKKVVFYHFLAANLKKNAHKFFDNIDGAKTVNVTKIARKAIENIALDSYETIIYLDLENF